MADSWNPWQIFEKAAVAANPDIDRQRLRYISYILALGIFASIFAMTAYAWLYVETQATTFLFILGTLVLAIVSVGIGFFFMRRGNLDVIAHAFLFGIYLIYGGFFFVWESGAGQLALTGTVLLVALSIQLFRRRWPIWIGYLLLFGLAYGLSTIWQPVPRFDNLASPFLRIFLPGFTGLLLIVLLLMGATAVSRSTIRVRLLASFLALALTPVILVGIFAILTSRINTEQQVLNQLESVATIKQQEIEAWLESLQVNLAISIAGGTAADRIEQLLTVNDTDTSIFQEAKRQIRGRFRDTISQSATRSLTLYEEIFLVDAEGRIVLSTDSLQEGKFVTAETFFQEGLSGVNYTHPPTYSPSLDKTTVVSVRPFFDRNGRVIGMVASRANMLRLNDIMFERAGLGETGETYLVGQNHVLLTNSRFPGYPANTTYVRTTATNTVLDNRQSGSGSYENYREDRVLGVYTWLDSLQVGLLAEQSRDEALTASQAIITNSLIIMVAMGFVATAAAYFITRSIADPLGELTDTATQVAAGRLNLTTSIERQDEIGTLAAAFDNMTVQLRNLVSTLEQRVLARTQALATSSQVGRQLSTILDQETLIQEVVTQVQSAFDYYHAHMYLIDATRTKLEMVGGTGDAGRQMLADGHAIPMGQGLVGRAAETNSALLVPDVSTEPDWLPNPLLPDTKAEVAVPISIGEEVLGVLDVQHNVQDGLQENDQTLLQSIANQVAIALRNARLYEEIQVQARREALVNTISQQILSTSDMETAMQVAARELGRALHAPRTEIRLLHAADEIDENGNGNGRYEA